MCDVTGKKNDYETWNSSKNKKKNAKNDVNMICIILEKLVFKANRSFKKKKCEYSDNCLSVVTIMGHFKC